jgi:DNA polymerase delta subunit 2
VFKYVDSDDRLEFAKLTLKCGHLAPTAPDSLWCHPFKDEDPFIIETPPRIYVIGNQPKYETSLYEFTNMVDKTRIVLLPRFSKEAVVVLVNATTLEVIPVSFGKK